ncbi:UDP-glycosyltransferase 88A1-like [Carya illinoinensis]|uniref:Glycosyltransferase n=1 Tax=Carya illinoinensis TaxID=32201 RepID=A0A8T1Q6S7_CARIL|nr:UDP-glycosyltransferase 88A1-like [Carya illinoinensis]KAG6649890.1 hypothetical protein CIPAW_06G005000 [Carya illinoinensis]
MEAIVLYPAPNMGHLISMVELAQLILLHHHHPSNSLLSVHILITSPPIDLGSPSPYIASVSATTPSIIFHHLPDPSPPLQPASFPSMEALVFEHINLTTPQVQTTLLSISLSSSIRAFVIDGFCTAALEVGTSLQIPTYYFFTSGASCLALFLYIPTLHKNTTKSFKDLNTHLHVPGLPPIPSSHMPEPTLDRTKEQHSWFLNFATRLPKSAGIIVNTFNSLEPNALKAISDGLCVQDGHTPPIFCVGPVIKSSDQSAGGQAECLKWLDSQPRGSVVYLCFGSLGTFSKEQLKEIAVGLEKSGQRFLWVVRSPPMKEQSQQLLSQSEEDPDLDSLLPESFLDRTREKGLVVKKWAPQVLVLSHDAVGSFVTHCGWNSVLEAICAGVPMVAWPLYAEQRFNKILLVEQLKLALPMNESEGGLVSAAEVERRVREIMESEEGNSVREQVLAKRQEAMAATSEQGSSRAALAKFMESAKR